ncbi:hypothetical protein [Methylobacterium sp. CM6257]
MSIVYNPSIQNWFTRNGPGRDVRIQVPRVSGKGGIQAAWWAITGINVSGMRIGVSGMRTRGG